MAAAGHHVYPLDAHDDTFRCEGCGQVFISDAGLAVCPNAPGTRQTAAPIRRLNLDVTYRGARELVRMMRDGLMTADLPYQRGHTWTLDQQVELVRSWLSGTPIPSIIVNDRGNPSWAAQNGWPAVSEPVYAVIDGKQRLTAAAAWFGGDFAVPASWFSAEDVLLTEVTGDGPYVRFAGLSKSAQTALAVGTSTFSFAAAKVATIADEAAIYLRVNGGGTPQTRDDMKRAAGVARP
jgi:hypothetical protein